MAISLVLADDHPPNPDRAEKPFLNWMKDFQEGKNKNCAWMEAGAGGKKKIL
jgi:hypothetical protein